MKPYAFLRSSLLAAAALFAGSTASASIMSTASITATQPSAGLYNYNLTLNNTGTTTIGTFWFSWIPGAGFLSAPPTNVLSPTGWTSTVTNAGAGIRWVDTGTLLGAGASLTGFNFTSTETPTQLASNFTAANGTTEPASIYFVYIGAPPPPPAAASPLTRTDFPHTSRRGALLFESLFFLRRYLLAHAGRLRGLFTRSLTHANQKQIYLRQNL